MQIFLEHYTDALLTLEQGRARALVDLILSMHDIQEDTTTNFENLSGITSFFADQRQNFLFMATVMNSFCLCFIDRLGNLSFKSYFATKFVFENDGLLSFVCSQSKGVACTEIESEHMECQVPSSLTQKREIEDADGLDPPLAYNSSVPFLHQVILSLADELQEDEEIIFVPKGPMFQVPFAALQSEKSEYLADKVRVRLVPSITTLKILQDLPADYHNTREALLVGDPYAPRVKRNGVVERLSRLPGAREEVERIGRLLQTSPLIGRQATRKAVLRKISNVSLIHIAAQGMAERGEIFLAADEPDSEVSCILTVEDIANVRIRAKLVVLSTCHSALGKMTTAEGIVGIARCFLGCGARSLLVSLWVVKDDVTLAFMTSFYKYLIDHRMSASRALRQAMREMRSSDKFNHVKRTGLHSFCMETM